VPLNPNKPTCQLSSSTCSRIEPLVSVDAGQCVHIDLGHVRSVTDELKLSTLVSVGCFIYFSGVGPKLWKPVGML